MKIKIKMFKEKRLIFEQGEGAVESSEGEKLPVGSYVNPDGSKYDAETNSYTNAHGDSVSLSPEDAEDRMAEGAIFVEAESSAVEVEATREEAGVIVEAETGHELDKVKAKLETVKGLKEIQAAMGKEFEKVAEILRGKVLRGKIEAGKLREGFVFLGGQEAFEGAVERLGESDMKALRDVLSKSFEFTDTEFPSLLSKIATVGTLSLFKEKIQAKYPHILTFEEFKSGAVDMNYDLSFDGTNVNLDLSLESGGQQLYDKHHAAEVEKGKTAAAEAAAAKKEEEAAKEVADTKAGRLAEIENHPIGGILVSLFGKEPGGFIDNIISGKSPVLAFILGGLGVSGFSKAYETARKLSSKHPKLKGIFEQVDSRLKHIREEAAKELGDKTKPEVATTIPQMTDTKFGEFLGIKSGVVPKESVVKEVSGGGLQLSKNFKIPKGKNLKVNLMAGSLVIPDTKSVNVLVDGNVVSNSALDGKSKTLKGEILTLAGDNDIPKQTIFTQGAKLELV